MCNRERYRKYRKEHPEIIAASRARNSHKHKKQRADYRNKYEKERFLKDPIYKAKKQMKWKRRITNLNDSYVADIIRSIGVDVTPETMFFVRQRIIMKRTLKEFKKWRSQNESNC